MKKSTKKKEINVVETSLTLNLKGTKVKLTLAEARELVSKVNQVLGNYYNSYPYIGTITTTSPTYYRGPTFYTSGITCNTSDNTLTSTTSVAQADGISNTEIKIGEEDE